MNDNDATKIAARQAAKRAIIIIIILIALFSFICIMLPIVSCWGVIASYERNRYLYEPEIKYGEFDFTVVYEVQGQQYTVSDTLVCEFEKVTWNWNVGYQLHFKEYIKSIGEEDILIVEDTIDGYKTSVSLGFAGGYFLNVESADTEMKAVFFVRRQGSPYSTYGILREDNDDYGLYEQYEFKIISFECDPPIVNSYPNAPEDWEPRY